MKKIFALLICLATLLSLSCTAIAAVEEIEQTVVEVSSWSEFEEAFANLEAGSGKSYLIKLTADLHKDSADMQENTKSVVSVNIPGCFVTLDFNGHLLSCTDQHGLDNYGSVVSDFIAVSLQAIDDETGVEFKITDSIGGGGIYMDSYRKRNTQLSALYVTEKLFIQDGTYSIRLPHNKLTIDGGTFYLKSRTEGDYNWDEMDDAWLLSNSYRAAVVTDHVNEVEINDGVFIAKAHNGSDDGAAKPLNAFATCSRQCSQIIGVYPTDLVINGGIFESDIVAVRHYYYDIYNPNSVITLPQINGGIFLGSLCYDVNPTLESLNVSNIINEDAIIVRTDRKGNEIEYNGLWTIYDLAWYTSELVVVSDTLVNFKTTPATTGKVTELSRSFDQSETFKLSYDNSYQSSVFSVDIQPYIAVEASGGERVVYQNIKELEIDYADYQQGVTVELGVTVSYNSKSYDYSNSYSITVASPQAAQILSQPESVTVEPGEWAELSVVADHAKAYRWYVYINSTPYPLDLIKSSLFPDGGLEGETSSTLRLYCDGVAKEKFYCLVTGTDDTTTKTNQATMTFGGAPCSITFKGGEYIEGGSAKFTLRSKYADSATWYIEKRISGSYNVYTLEEFAEKTGCEYYERHRKLSAELYETTVEFYDLTQSSVNACSVGYELSNSIGKVSFNPENVLPFTLKEIVPQITEAVAEYGICIEGEDLNFSFKGTDMTDAEWRFLKTDSEGIEVVYGLDEMKEIFTESGFETSFSTDSTTGISTATFTLQNARAELFEYSLATYAKNANGIYLVGVSEVAVIPVYEYQIGDCDENYRNITVLCPQAGTYTLHIAGYDSLGKLADLNSRTIDFARGKATYDVEEELSDCSEVKVMLWDDEMQPLCNYYQN